VSLIAACIYAINLLQGPQIHPSFSRSFQLRSFNNFLLSDRPTNTRLTPGWAFTMATFTPPNEKKDPEYAVGGLEAGDDTSSIPSFTALIEEGEISRIHPMCSVKGGWLILSRRSQS
jgi:hypothetical protein